MTNIQHNTAHRSKGKVFAGLFLLTIGTILLLDKLGFYFPRWIFSWPMILIAIGIFSGIKHKFTRPGAFILIIIGVVFLADRVITGISFSMFIWPGLIIMAGLFMIFGKNRRRGSDFFNRNDFEWNKKVTDSATDTNESFASDQYSQQATSDDFIDSVSIFGGVKKNILSKNFRGGEIVNFFGGTEINLSQADINGRVILDVTQVFGGTKIILPPHWRVQSEMAAIFGGIEDKRRLEPESALDKILVIKGTSVFGGIDIRNY